MSHTIKATRLADIEARLAKARQAIAYADHCVKEAKALKFPAVQVAVITADADRLRGSAKAVVTALLDEKKAVTS